MTDIWSPSDRTGHRPRGGGAGACNGSERAAVREPNTRVAQVGLLGQKVVVAVVVEDPEPVRVRDRGDDHIDRRQAVMTDVRELALRIERALLDLLIDANPREREQIADQRDVVSAAARRVASLEQKRQANGEPARLEQRRDLASTLPT